MYGIMFALCFGVGWYCGSGVLVSSYKQAAYAFALWHGLSFFLAFVHLYWCRRFNQYVGIAFMTLGRATLLMSGVWLGMSVIRGIFGDPIWFQYAVNWGVLSSLVGLSLNEGCKAYLGGGI